MWGLGEQIHIADVYSQRECVEGPGIFLPMRQALAASSGWEGAGAVAESCSQTPKLRRWHIHSAGSKRNRVGYFKEEGVHVFDSLVQ